MGLISEQKSCINPQPIMHFFFLLSDQLEYLPNYKVYLNFKELKKKQLYLLPISVLIRINEYK